MSMRRVDLNESEHSQSRCSGVKALLKRYNMIYEERIEGNTVIIEIKAKAPGTNAYSFPKAQLNSDIPKD